MGNVRLACPPLGISRKALYKWKKHLPMGWTDPDPNHKGLLGELELPEEAS